ncbi:MAG: YidC/Oxa1 family membrane protein insertase [Candidatus Microsaccharimonas sossegonensis]|uniref:YidC/Oxa1 family membrane protein insertase n=1 Tax=Candidatus Microsaccharimonas sossegonensis TaxID=2506948 RepID=A0A4Q0AGS8_9BACT|nr:MAG: YidC/Oxa1 family membrane protein insertase [Candidatus Microsaccharimonas sossegonensis]
MNIFETLIVQPIFNLLIGIYSIIPGADFGVALIIFTILVRFAMWPLVVRQLHQVKQMRKLQPKLAQIKKATKGNKQLESMQMLELYKEHGVKPFRSILTLLIQLPIFIALYQVIQIFTTQRDQIDKLTYGLLKNIGPIKDLIAHPENFKEKLFGVIDLSAHAIGDPGGLNVFLILLAILAAGSQYFISRQTNPNTTTKRFRDVMAEAADGKAADQSELNAVMMNKMTKILPFFMLFIMLGLPGALALYYATSNLFAAVQQHYILKRDVKEMDEIASEVKPPTGKKATAKAREKQAREAMVTGEKITRITAKDTPRK